MARSIAKLACVPPGAKVYSRRRFFQQPTERDSMRGLASWSGVTLLLFAISASSAAATGWQHIGNVQRVEKLQDGVELTAGSATGHITAFRPGMIRVHLTPQGSFPKGFSWAVIESPEPPAINIEDGKFQPRMTVGRVVVIVKKT